MRLTISVCILALLSLVISKELEKDDSPQAKSIVISPTNTHQKENQAAPFPRIHPLVHLESSTIGHEHVILSTDSPNSKVDLPTQSLNTNQVTAVPQVSSNTLVSKAFAHNPFFNAQIPHTAFNLPSQVISIAQNPFLGSKINNNLQAPHPSQNNNEKPLPNLYVNNPHIIPNNNNVLISSSIPLNVQNPFFNPQTNPSVKVPQQQNPVIVSSSIPIPIPQNPNNNFQGSASVPLYVHNPFLNPTVLSEHPLPSQSELTTLSNINSPSTTPPSSYQPVNPNVPIFIHNPFLNPKPNDETIQPIVPTTTYIPLSPSTPVNQHQVPTQPFVPSFVHNPFLNPQQNNGINTQPGATTVPTQHVNTSPSVPSYEHNPFFKPGNPLEVNQQFPQGNVGGTPPTASPSFPSQNTNSVYPQQPQTTSPVYTTNPPFYNPSFVPNNENIPAIQQPDTTFLRAFCVSSRGQFPSSRCGTFINCWDNSAIEQPCPPGLLFNTAGYCDYPGNVECHGRILEGGIDLPILEQPTNNIDTPHLPNAPQQPTTQQTIQVPPTIFVPTDTNLPLVFTDSKLREKCLNKRGQFPSDFCHKYIECWDGSAAEHECPAGLHFSDKGYCDYMDRVNCNNRTVVTITSKNDLCPRPDGTFRDKTNCSRYYTCISNHVVQYECPDALQFNEAVGVCDYAFNVNCNNGINNYAITENADFLQKVPAALVDVTLQCKPGSVFPLNSQCTTVTLCRNGLPEVIHCPLGLAYDAPTDKCVLPTTARCLIG